MGRSRVLILIAVALTSACQSETRPSELSSADIAAIRATSARWLAAVQAGRWEDAAATYTDDAILWFPEVTFNGKDAILKSFQAQQPMAALDLHIDEIHGSGNVAYVSGYSTIAPNGGAPVLAARYLDVRVRQPDGSWLFHRDMVSPVPPAESKPTLRE
jgi:uncharacterized protein (TIGR02246 family)